MKKTLLTAALAFGLSAIASAKVVTLTVNSSSFYGQLILTNTVSIGTNEVATITSMVQSGLNAEFCIVKDGVTNLLADGMVQSYNDGRVRPYVIAGPASFILRIVQQSPVSTGPCLVTLEIAPESFPPDKTIILPEGTVGVIHVESSTNLIRWQDEWVNTFSNTNHNRFFRIRAERSLP